MISNSTIEWVKAVMGRKWAFISAAPLIGGTSTSIFKMCFEYGSITKQVVLRIFDNQKWLQSEPDLLNHEEQALKFAVNHDLIAPEVLAIREGGIDCPPVLLMTCLDGYVDLSISPHKMTSQLANELAKIHQVDAEQFSWNYFTYNDLSQLKIPEWSDKPNEWKMAIEIVNGKKPTSKTCFIHRDYHPVNVLWNQDRISGIVDWVNACEGPPGIDVGHCRLNLALLYSVDCADLFLNYYQEANRDSFTYHPYWDLVSLTEFLPGPPTVFKGWIDYGVTNLTDEMVKLRIEQYLISLLKHYSP